MKFKSEKSSGQTPRSLDGFLSKSPPKKKPVSKLVEPENDAVEELYFVNTPASQESLPAKSEAKKLTMDDLIIDLDNGKKSRRNRRKNKKIAKQHKQDGTKHRKAKKFLKRGTLLIVALFLIVGGWLGWKFYQNASRITGNKNPLNLFSALTNTPLKNTDGRTNILVAGNSTDDPGHDGASLTDSIMVLSIDTKTRNAFILSIPRDLWVYVPGLGHQKINTANTMKNFKQTGYPDGGMGALEQVVSKNLGIPIHYYALINYGAFRDTVKALGGINIVIASPDKRGLYDPNISKRDGGPLKLPNGSVKLDGQTALNLARARGDSYYSYGFPLSDFDRTTHQRQMLLAVKDKASSAGVLSNPLKVGQLADAVGKNVQTDLKLNEVQSLIHQTKDLSNNNIKSLNLNNLAGENTISLRNYMSDSGQSALIPAEGVDNFTVIQLAIKKLMSSDPVVKESASVVVLNGSSTEGLSKLYATKLANKGMAIAITANAPTKLPTTTLVDNSKNKKPATLSALKAMFGDNVSTNATLTASYPSADFIVILGANQAVPQ